MLRNQQGYSPFFDSEILTLCQIKLNQKIRSAVLKTSPVRPVSL